MPVNADVSGVDEDALHGLPALVELPPACMCAFFVRRVKRFSILCHAGGQEIWAHSNNTGGMLGLLRAGAPVLLSHSGSPGRKLPWTLERVWIDDSRGGFWCGVNTSLPNKMLEAAFYASRLSFCQGYTAFARERRNGCSRLDACLTGAGRPPIWVECKSVTLVEDGVAAFPDAQSERGRKHLRELKGLVERGARAAMFYLVQRPDCYCFAPADYIDPEYARLFHEARAAGVEIYPYKVIFTSGGAALGAPLPLAHCAGM